jgi:hypothetical protein
MDGAIPAVSRKEVNALIVLAALVVAGEECSDL